MAADRDPPAIRGQNVAPSVSSLTACRPGQLADQRVSIYSEDEIPVSFADIAYLQRRGIMIEVAADNPSCLIMPAVEQFVEMLLSSGGL